MVHGQEQLSINQPLGIQEYYQKILNKVKDPHEAEHKMMDCIAEMIFSSQKNNAPLCPSKANSLPSEMSC
jgi:hypothetical protein